jgi:dynein light intermediate chain 1
MRLARPDTCAGRATEVALPLEEGVLIHNLGLPLVVVCTKCDTMDALDGLNDEHFDFIQRRLRRLCLQCT